MNTSNDLDKEDKLLSLYDELEKELTYLGSTAIEDLLQEDVPNTIRDLMTAGIKMWVLTGDKQETAIEIGKSCNIIDLKSMDLIILSSSTKDQFEEKLKESFNNYPKENRQMTIVIDGSTLAFALEDEVLSTIFY